VQDLANAENVGQRVRTLRLARNLSQQTLASDAGVALRTVANLEGGQDVSLDTLRKLAAVLGVTVAALVGGPAE
jgi:transcriptional regulator with XRE-family HTH domain